MIIIFKSDNNDIYIDYEEYLHREGTLSAVLGTRKNSVTIRNLVRNIDIATNVDYREFIDEKDRPHGDNALDTVNNLLQLFTGNATNLFTCLDEICMRINKK